MDWQLPYLDAFSEIQEEDLSNEMNEIFLSGVSMKIMLLI